jgi:RNA polymerase sigma-70 factor (ECF subfamily)
MMATTMKRQPGGRPKTGGSFDDRALVDAVLSGDADAFQHLVERDARLVIGVCTRILRDPAEAEDVAQEAFLKAYQALGTFRGDGSFGAWVTRIAVRRAGARLAARHAGRSLQIESHDGAIVDGLRAGMDLELEAINDEDRSALWAAVAALPSGQRQTVALRFTQDLSIDEIAALTGTPAGTVKSRLHRALRSLREHLEARSET